MESSEHKIKIFNCLRSSIFLKEENVIEKNVFLLSCFTLQNWLLTQSEGEVKYSLLYGDIQHFGTENCVLTFFSDFLVKTFKST